MVRSDCGLWRAVCGLVVTLALATTGTALAAQKKKPSDGSCSDEDDYYKLPWRHVKGDGTCFEFSNNLSYVYQKLLDSGGSPAAPTRAGTASVDHPVIHTVTYKPRLETTSPTAFGDFKTVFGVSAQYTSDSTVISTTLSEGTLALGGVTVGYTDSAMNFWNGDFQFTAATPARTVGVARYEYEILPDTKLGLSLETGAPTNSSSSTVFVQTYPDDPVLAARWLYETDPLSVQLAAMVHRGKIERDRQPPAIANPADYISGWAATAGATFEVPVIGDDDEVSAQAAYAVNASSYLGTAADLSTLASVLPFKADTRGWSAVASYHRQWSEMWESNFFVSRLALDVATPLSNPTLRTTRLAANLIFNLNSDTRFGAELGFLDMRIERNGTIGILSGASGRLMTGYLFAEIDF